MFHGDISLLKIRMKIYVRRVEKQSAKYSIVDANADADTLFHYLNQSVFVMRTKRFSNFDFPGLLLKTTRAIFLFSKFCFLFLVYLRVVPNVQIKYLESVVCFVGESITLSLF